MVKSFLFEPTVQYLQKKCWILYRKPFQNFLVQKHFVIRSHLAVQSIGSPNLKSLQNWMPSLAVNERDKLMKRHAENQLHVAAGLLKTFLDMLKRLYRRSPLKHKKL
jgi:hypothetical protein